MKLHLPKTLLVAVLAACVAPTWAGQWVVDDSNQYYDCYQFTGTDDATSLNLKEVYTVNGEDYSHIKDGVTWIRAGESSLTTPVSISATLTEVEMGAGNKLIISGTWNNENHAFKALTIEALKITDNTGAYGAGILVIAEDSDKVLANQSVTIGSIYGSLSELKVDSHGTLKLNGLRYISGKNENNENVWADTFSSGSSVSIEGVLDLTGITFGNGTHGDNQAVAKLMNVATGTGTIKLASGAQIQTAGNRDAVTLSTNYVVDGGSDAKLVLASWKKNEGWRTWTVTTNGSLTVGDGAGKLNIRAGQELVLDGGDVTAGELYLGHTSSGNPGKLTMNNAQSQLTVSSILGLCGNDNSGFNNEVEITAGTLKVTGANALGLATDDFAEGNTVNSPILNATIGGSGENGVLLQTGSTDVAFKGDSTTLGGGKLTIGNITIDADNTNRITITDAVLNGKITNAGGADKLTIGGHFTIGTITDLAEKEAVSGFVLDSNDLTTTNDLQNGFIIASGSYWLVEGKTTLEDGTTLTNEAGDVAYTLTSDDSGIYTTIAPSIDKSKYYVTSGDVAVSSTLGADSYVVRGGTMNISGTINASDIEYTSGAITLADAKSVLVLDNATNAATLLSQTTGELGTIKVTTDTTMTGAAQAKGKLIVEGAQLTVEPPASGGNGSNKIANSYLTSFTSIDLNNATVRYHGSTSTWKNVTVGEDGATIKIKDMDSNNSTTKVLTLDGTTTLDGALSIESSWQNDQQTWKYGVNIAALTGTGDLTIKGTTHSDSNDEQNHVTAKLLDTYTGIITVEQSSNNTSVTKFTATADGAINLKGLNIVGGSTVNLDGVVGIKNLCAVSVDASSGLTLNGTIGNMTAAANAGTIALGNGAQVTGTTSITGGTINVGNNVSVSGSLSLGSDITLGGTLSNTGKVTLNGNVTISSLNVLASTAGEYTDGDNGYLSSAQYYVVQSTGDSAGVVLGGTDQKVNGTYALETSGSNIVINVNEANPGGTYFVNTSVNYGGENGSTQIAADTTTGITMNGGTLNLNTALANTTDGFITTANAGGIINVASGVTLNNSSVSSAGGMATLKGVAATKTTAASIYNMGVVSMDGGNTAANNVTKLNAEIGEGWQGTVVFEEGSSLKYFAFDLNDFGVAGSTIQFNGVAAGSYLGQGTGNAATYAANIELNGDGFSIENGFSGTTYTFTGAFSGSGSFNMNKAELEGQYYVFSGDMSQWTGELKQSQAAAVRNGITHTYSYTFNENSTTIANKVTAAAGTMVVKVDNDSAVSMTGDVTADGGVLQLTKTGGSKLTVNNLSAKGSNVELTGTGDNAIEVATLNVADGKTVTGTADVTVTGKLDANRTEGVALTGALTLKDGVTVDVTDLLQDDTYTYNLASATNGVTVGTYSVTGLGDAYSSYQGRVSAVDPNTAAGVAAAAEGNSNTNLVLTLELVKLTVTGATGYADGVLTLTTAEKATGAIFGESLAASVSDDIWAQITKDYTLDEEYSITFVGADGTTFDFDGDGTLTAPTITFMGETATALIGNGTIVGTFTIPEPTTATLSLLALAALAARRRRR